MFVKWNPVIVLTVCSFMCLESVAQTVVPEVLVVSGRAADDLGFPGDRIAFMYNFNLSPDGSWWVGEFELDENLDAVVLRGSGVEQPQVIWAEHDPVPGFPDEEFRTLFDDRPNAIDNQGRVVGLANRNRDGLNRPLVYKFDGIQLSLVATQGTEIPSLPFDYGDLLHSPNVLATGSASFVAENMLGAMKGEDEAILIDDGNQTGQQSGTTSYGGELLRSFVDEMYFVNPNGAFLFDGFTDGAAGQNKIVVFGETGTDGDAVLREDTTAIAFPNGLVEPFDRAHWLHLAPNNDWYVLGDTNGNGSSTDVAIRNGKLLCSENETAPDGFRYRFPVAIAGDEHGNYVWIWETDNPDPSRNTVVVYNRNQLLIREGDMLMVDVDGDGIDDPAAIVDLKSFNFVNLAIGGGYVYLMVEIDVPNILFGNAFIRIPIFVPGDVNRDGMVNLLDVQPFVALLSSGQFQVEADTNGDGLVNLLDVGPLIELLSN